MTGPTRRLLLGAAFLSGLLGAALSQRGHCAENQCWVLPSEKISFHRAHKLCTEFGGELPAVGPDRNETLKTLFDGFKDGPSAFWLAAEAGQGLQRCSSVSVDRAELATQGRQCAEELPGFLCQFPKAGSCSGLAAAGGQRVTYQTPWGFKARDLKMLPQGTIAVLEKLGGEYPLSKQLCFSHNWEAAPWKCDVEEGGCEHQCDKRLHACTCPAGRTLLPNGFSCSRDQEQATCDPGYEPAPDGQSCVDVDECARANNCTGGEECHNSQGDYSCACPDGFVKDDEVCVDASICDKCEHMLCVNRGGVYRCECRQGFKVSEQDPTKCTQHCQERDCLATCVIITDAEKDRRQCYCPTGYVLDVRNDTDFCTDFDECDLESQCMHKCENLMGGYRCSCEDGYKLVNDYACVLDKEEKKEKKEKDEEEEKPASTPASSSPAVMPSYIKTGSALGIGAFVVLCAALLLVLVRQGMKLCGTLNLYSFKHPDIDIFYLQQVTTDAYKRLSVDKQFMSDGQTQ